MKLQLHIFLLLGESIFAKLNFTSQNVKCEPPIRTLYYCCKECLLRKITKITVLNLAYKLIEFKFLHFLST